jgi:hypothetical protein
MKAPIDLARNINGCWTSRLEIASRIPRKACLSDRVLKVLSKGLASEDERVTMNNSRTALVTGATKGIGFALSTQLNQAGWNVVGIARHPVDDFPGKLSSITQVLRLRKAWKRLNLKRQTKSARSGRWTKTFTGKKRRPLPRGCPMDVIADYSKHHRPCAGVCAAAVKEGKHDR